MEYAEIKKRIAPCGITCHNCFAFRNGNIRILSEQLESSLGNFEPYAARFKVLLNEPVFENYPAFKKMLVYFSSTACNGCRIEKCKLFAACKIRECSKAKGVDYCFQCEDFPCNDTGFDQDLYMRYVKNNMKMKESGVEKYYEEIKEKPRY